MRIETVSYTINWRKMRKGHSFFVPCIDHRAARRTLKQVAERLGLSLVFKVVVVEGVKGLRVWRV
jgi:hypothetical protein